MGKKSRLQKDAKKRAQFRQTDPKSMTQHTGSCEIDLSVIIPAYNLEDCIGKCLDSVLAQEIEKMEIIVVNDCSTDKTSDIIQAYAQKHSQIIPIDMAVNQGPAGARNAALDVAKGEFIHFCDGDDAVPEGAYKEFLRVAWEEKADIVTGNYSRLYPNEHNAVRPFSHYSAPTGLERCFESGNTMLWNKIYRRDLIEREHLRFDASMVLYEDYLFYSQFILKNPVAEYTDMYVYTYTEPAVRSTDGNIRYANIECALNLDRAWRKIFSSGIQKNYKLWREAYWHNLSWYYNWSWKWIQNLQVRQHAFEILRSLVCWVEQTVEFCSWLQPGGAQEFFDIFHIDYVTFCSIRCEDYLLHLAVLDNIHPRGPSAAAEEELERVPYLQRDDVLRKSIREQLVDLQTSYQGAHVNKALWKNHYWNLIDSIVNDYWRQVMNFEEREALFLEIKVQLNKILEQNLFLRLSTPDDVWRFKQIFCVDYATLQALNTSQYMAVCIPRFTDGGKAENGGGYAYTPELIDYFVTACRDGRVGLRGILKSLKAWLTFKLARKKR